VIAPFQVARLLDLVMMVAILLLTVLVFWLNRSLRKHEQRLAELVRTLALERSAQKVPRRPGEQAEDQVGRASERA
jgi:hypothetical protein